MNPTEYTAQQRDPRRRSPQPETDREATELAQKAGTPEAVKAAKTGHRAEVTRTTQDVRRARGVEWVRPTDLIARHSASIAGRGVDFEAALARRARRVPGTATRASGRGISAVRMTTRERARRLPNVSEFGRGSRTSSWVTRSGIGLG
ncbi:MULTISPECIES: hypothetical protein [unclassified Microbacterium]|uniref:hypothetical protein n=1 Tax=unclassified Microbacterium TaxID=2609290 RepID=UPI000EA84FD5|nr:MULTISPECIES: hypothetical protein [unclassified Microbacterium]MBT2483115.1 hypothetical protein [Microbacterium sp. ISL-108]RKN66174.1 hypothetical protein D7252_00175 [Microbacterium sp. CGR2]